ncbi:MAG: thiolase C-terminal domain-containing protein [Desertimonas sp.]
MRRATAVVGVGESEYTFRGAARHTEFQLACIAIRNAVADAGLSMSDVDGLVSYMDRNEPVRLSAALGTGDLDWTAQTFGGGGNGAGAAVTLADAAVSAGYAECVVAYRSLAQGQFARYGRAGRMRRSSGVAAFTAPYGLLTPAQITAMQTTRFMHDHGVTQDSLAEVALASYAHAQRNPRAVRYGTPLTRDEYHASRWIAEPFHLYDCCPENDGAAAVVVTTTERARDLRATPVTIVAAAHGLARRDGVGAFNEANFPTAHHRHVGRKLWERAGVGPSDIPVAQFYENFTGPVLMAIAEMGFCEAGELDGFVADGGIRWPDGRLPINTSGGNLGEGYIHGFGNVVEAVRQVRGESTCQVGDGSGVELSLSVSGPGYAPGSAVLFGRV